MKYIYKMFSMDSCAPVLGQMALDLMINPPQPGDPSYPLYDVVSRDTVLFSRMFICLIFFLKITNNYCFCSCLQLPVLQEKQHIRAALVHNVKKARAVLNSLPGFCCQPVEAGIFVFPRLHLPPKAIQKAKVPIPSYQMHCKTRAMLLICHKPMIKCDAFHVLGSGNEARHVLLLQAARGGWCVRLSRLWVWTKGRHLPHQV